MQDVLKMGSGYQGDGRAGAQGEDAWITEGGEKNEPGVP